MVTNGSLQDNKGRFAKGHPFIGNRNGIKNGAKKTIIGEVKDALKLAEDAMPQIFRAMIARANNPEDPQSQRASEYLADRIYGKPNQPLTGMGGKSLEIVVRWDGNKRGKGSEEK